MLLTRLAFVSAYMLPERVGESFSTRAKSQFVSSFDVFLSSHGRGAPAQMMGAEGRLLVLFCSSLNSDPEFDGILSLWLIRDALRLLLSSLYQQPFTRHT